MTVNILAISVINKNSYFTFVKKREKLLDR